MSDASSDYPLSLDVGKEKSIIWLGTRYYENIPYNVDNMNADIIWERPELDCQYVNILLEFRFTRISELEFRLTCFQRRSAPQGYMLRFHCFTNIFHEYNPKVFHMRSNQFVNFEQFWLNAAYSQRFSAKKFHKRFYLKIKVEMIEYECSSTIMSKIQEEEFHLMKTRYFNDESVLTDLCYILNVPRVKDIFTGRQKSEFFVKKSAYITRTATFSKEIANYLRTKEACIPVPLTDLGIILNFIWKSKRTSIKYDIHIFMLYFDAYYLGLNYLAILMRDFLIARMENENDELLVTVALKAADRVCDDILFDKVAERFHYLEQQKGDPEGWLKGFKSIHSFNRYTAHALKRRLTMKESAGHEETPETSKEASEKN